MLRPLLITVLTVSAWFVPQATAQPADAPTAAEPAPPIELEHGSDEPVVGSQTPLLPPLQAPLDPLPAPVPVVADPEDTPARAVAPAVAPQAPPMQWREWDLEGVLIDDKDTVRALFASVMDRRQTLTAPARAELIERARSIGYELLDIDARPMPTGATLAVLVLRPVPLVRKLDIDIDNDWWDVRSYPDTVFEDEIRRRMRLRQGASLASDRAERSRQLRAEELRILDYLRDEGFFEARVAVTDTPAGRYAAIIEVDIDKGPRYRVGRVTVTGNEAVRANEIVRIFRHKLVCILTVCGGKRKFTRAQLNRDLEAVATLYQRRGYPGVRVRTDFDPTRSFNRARKTVDFTINISERRKIDVVFQGNDPERAPASRLEELLTFDAEGAYDDVEVDASAQAIQTFYQRRGYFEANVTWARERFSFFDRILFYIDEGPQLKVEEVRFEGNKSLSAEALRGVVATQVFRSLPILGSSGFVTSEQLEEDVARLRDLYRRQGFPAADVRVRVARGPSVIGNAAALAATVAAATAADELYVRFLIDEGPRRTVGNIDFTFAGPHTRSVNELKDVLDLAPGDPLYDERLEQQINRLGRFYFQSGYPRARIVAKPSVDSETGAVNLTFEVTESQLVELGKVAIRGNFKTREWVIRDELRFEEGQPLTLSRAERGQQNLRNTALFDAVRVAFVDFDDPSQNRVNVVVHVEERHDHGGQVALGAGYSTQNEAFVDASWTAANLFGIGLKNELQTILGNRIQSLDNKITAPRWIARKLTGLTVHTDLYGFIRSENTRRFGDLLSFGGSLAFSKSGRHGFWRGWLLSLRYDLRQRERDEDLIRVAGASDDITQSPVTTRTGALGPTLVIDKRRDSSGQPNPLVPEKGFRLELRASLAHEYLFGQNRFIKLGVSGQHFLKLGSRLLLTQGVRYDHGIPLGDDSLLPEVERFFAGGDTTVRGFEQDQLATEVIEQPLAPIEGITSLRILPAGGNVRFIHNLDLQLRVWEVFDLPVASALFVDTGLITNSAVDTRARDLRHAIGLALFRLLAPFGSLSLEYAVPLDPAIGDNPRGRFHFNFALLFS